MNKKVFHTLEYDKIIQKLIKHAASPLGKQYCRDLTPYTDEETTCSIHGQVRKLPWHPLRRIWCRSL